MAISTSTGSLDLPRAFYFSVMLHGSSGSGEAFQEVEGIHAVPEFEIAAEGGENRFAHTLPKQVSHPCLVLKRGVAALDSPLIAWCRSALESTVAAGIPPREIKVYLLDPSGKPLRAWAFDEARPVKWNIAEWPETNGTLAIESIELTYSALRRLD